MPDSSPILALSFGLTFTDLYHNSGLEKLDDHFQTFLLKENPELGTIYQFHRQNVTDEKSISALLLEVAPYLEDFIGQLFQIEKNIQALQQQHHYLNAVPQIKRQFVQRRACRQYPYNIAITFDGDELRQHLIPHMNPFTDVIFANTVSEWLKDEVVYEQELDLAARYAAWATFTDDGRSFHRSDVLFRQPEKLDFQKLIPFHLVDAFKTGLFSHQRQRVGFDLTDEGLNRLQAIDQANYCIWCHHQAKDSCSKGMKPKGEAVNKFIKNWAEVNLTGCPLEEKISEMNESKAQGFTLAALAIAIIDNPMIAATGHRICNDCMKACIYQKQEPVNIPGTETQILKDVLQLPWGFEIYSLFTRWNPLNMQRPFPQVDSGYKVLVVGTGPAGFTLAHHLLNDGHAVVAIEGLKIEPLPAAQSGVDVDGERHSFTPIYSITALQEELSSRITGGFGGVAEYGITVRWDKNYLKMIRLLLERRQNFALFGGVRFGGTLTIDQAFSMGFDHIALCMGAGSPTLISMKNSLAIGVRQASDFLMALQLTGAAKLDSITNLQVRLPAVIIGGGLTAIDTATETMAYYPQQVEKFYKRYQQLSQIQSISKLRQQWSDAELVIVDEYLMHGAAIINERQAALNQNRIPNFQKLIQQWGGVTVAYRRDVTQAPSYVMNHEEVAIALEEGIQILDHAVPIDVNVDAHGHAESLTIRHYDQEQILPARTILIAAGTKPNTNLKYDEMNYFSFAGNSFQAFDEAGHPVTPQKIAKPDTPHVLMSILDNQKSISFFGDMHPSFAGNVVKAMGSAKQGYPVVSRMLHRRPVDTDVSAMTLIKQLNHQLRAKIYAVTRLTPTIIEITVEAPLAAQNFQPGQFYRLQNFEAFAPIYKETRFVMEGLALTGARVDREKGLLSTIVLEMGGSSDLCALLQPGDPVVLMGPTGAPTEIPHRETVLLAGGGLGNAVLFSIGQALRANGCQVIYFAGYKKIEDRYKISEIEAAADQIVWCCDELPGFAPSRSQDLTFVGNIVAGMEAYATGKIGDALIPLHDVQRIIAIGSDKMMAAIAKARKTNLKAYLNPDHIGIGSINSPMQCMMKEICAQCLQRHIDPLTGKEVIVYSCSNQDQNLDWVDWDNLGTRLRQNSVQEKLTKEWIRYCLS
jgi:NADPH-dependent glutamate synthase beta subunit-like oxidoreductase/NAD(P)H-flavin reductase